MKKAKFVFKVNRNNTAKVYVNKKWQKDVCSLDVLAYPFDITVRMEQLKRNEKGFLLVVNDEIVKKTSSIHFGARNSEV